MMGGLSMLPYCCPLVLLYDGTMPSAAALVYFSVAGCLHRSLSIVAHEEDNKYAIHL